MRRSSNQSKTFSEGRPLFLVTAGPTRERLDPARFFSNPSTGKMGYAVARAARERGARVILITGPTFLRAPRGMRVIRVESAREMRGQVMRHYPKSDVVVMAAAVSDYRPGKRLAAKMKKTRKAFALRMVRNPDILEELGKRKEGKILVGFAAETGSILRQARRKLLRKNLDMIVANDVSLPGSGFGSDFNKASLLFRNGTEMILPGMRKEKLARLLVLHCLRILRGRI